MAIYANTTARLVVVVVLHICRTLLAEATEIVDKLNAKVATDNTVGKVLGITRACAANECSILISYVVNTDLYLTQLVAEYLFTKVEVAENVVLIVLVRKAEVLDVRASCSEGKALPEYPLERTINRVVEVVIHLILAILILAGSGVPRLVERSVPRYCEVDLFGDVTTESYLCIVADVVSVVIGEFVIQHIIPSPKLGVKE